MDLLPGGRGPSTSSIQGDWRGMRGFCKVLSLSPTINPINPLLCFGLGLSNDWCANARTAH